LFLTDGKCIQWGFLGITVGIGNEVLMAYAEYRLA
jgi:hypothetical protein